MRVDNSVNDRVYPQKADFTFYGGIYRDVSLLVVNKNHIALGHFGDTGVKITPALQENSADIRVETLVEGSGTVAVELLDAEGRTVAKGEGENAFLHLVYPNRPLGFSEYGAEGMPNLHSVHPRRGDHTEEYQAKYFGIGGEKTEKIKVSEYIQIIRNNDPMQRLMVAGAGCKLALSIATNTTVLCMLYSCMMGNYDGLYLPMMVLGYVCSVPFFLLTVRTSQKEGQKASLMKYVSVALVCYVGVLLLLWGRGDAFTLSILGENGLSINLYTILFIVFFGIGYGAYYATADMPIPMVADCSDYETYRSGKYIPGIMGTLFSLVDKLVSSLSATVVGIAVSFVGLQSLPTQYDPYTPGMNWVVIVLFCIIPMVAWAATLIAMKGYTLTGAKMKEIQAVNACRRDAVAKGMKLEEAMDKWQTMDQLPAKYRS